MKSFAKLAVLAVFIACAALWCTIADVIEDARGRRGKASFYGEAYRGRTMANGQPFDPDELTCASWDYPLGTVLLVAHEDRKVEVTVTDRGPRRDLAEKGIIIDLSARAFDMIDSPRRGITEISVSVKN